MGHCSNNRNYMNEMRELICEIVRLKPEPEICNVRCPPMGCPRGPCPGICCYKEICDPCCISEMPSCTAVPNPSRCKTPSCFPCEKTNFQSAKNLSCSASKICNRNQCNQLLRSFFTKKNGTVDRINEILHKIPSKMYRFIQIIGNLLPDVKSRDKIDQSNEEDMKTYSRNSLPAIISLLPSEYMKHLLMTTEERMELTSRVNPRENHDFEFMPRVVVFQNYTPGNVYNATLTIRNIGRNLQCLKLKHMKDPTLNVEFNTDDCEPLKTRLAPGMYNTYIVRFSPEEKRDYEYTIEFVTDREVFNVKVIGIGPRPILDFPDLISMPETGVKVPRVKSLHVRNVGDAVAVFTISTSSSFFSVEPCKGAIEEEEIVQFVVNFLPMKSGFFQDNFMLKYESGESIRIKVEGSAINCNVRVERRNVKIQDETYLGLATLKTLKIFNRSDYIVKYQWMEYKDMETDINRKEEHKKKIEIVNNAKISRCMDNNICESKSHDINCQRIYPEEMISLANENFYYKNNHFSLMPMIGEIWPQSFVDVEIYFEPKEVGELSSTAYLEVTGREDRIPVSLSGLAIGPQLKLNVTTLDIGNIFLCSVHNYQIMCKNKGCIPGVLMYTPKPLDFGGNITINPQFVKIEPGDFKNLFISFSSNKNGNFVERIEFVIKESLQIVSLYIKGRIICPTLYFDRTLLDLKTTALGFTSKDEVNIYNDSLVPVLFRLCVPDDGTEAVLAHEDFVNTSTKSIFPSSPKEFQIFPEEGTVEAQSSFKVKINFTPNLARIGETYLRLDIRGTDSVPVTLPISFTSKIASLIVKPEEIDIRFCFVNFPYSRTFTIENNSDVDACFYLTPQTVSDSTSIFYSMSMSQGYLGPGESKKISLTIITREIGKQKCVISMLIFGRKAANDCCVITCSGQGPVVSVEPTSLDWEKVNLLQEETMKLRLISDSPIPAEYKVSLETKNGKNSSWKVLPTSGDLGPGESVDLFVTIFLKDVGSYSDNIIVTITNSRRIFVPLSAIGIGSCVVCNPPIVPTFDMGLLFSHQDNSLPIDVTNKGSRHLKLLLSNTAEIRLKNGQIPISTSDNFVVEPFIFELPAESTKTVTCTARSEKCETATEQWWLHCFVEGQGKREILGKTLFTAIFVAPSIIFSKRELSFRIDMCPSNDKSRQIDQFFITNESGLDINAHLSIGAPFSIINDDDDGDHVQNMKFTLGEQTKRLIRIIFSPKNEQRCYSQTYKSLLRIDYHEHPNVDKIKCVGSLNFPNVERLPQVIQFDCPIGSSVVEDLFLKNNGPLDVSYKFNCMDETIVIERASYIKEIDTDTISDTNYRSDSADIIAETNALLLDMLTMVEEMELSELESRTKESSITDEIHEILAIKPYEGLIGPYSTKCISIDFHPKEQLTFEAKISCDISGGPSEIINIIAAADTVQYTLDKDLIDFGQQMICESAREMILLENRSNIRLGYHVESIRKCNFLKVQPISGVVPPQSIIQIEVLSQPVIPGFYNDIFMLCIDHVAPIDINVKGIVIIPQIYVDLPRKHVFTGDSVELGYRAVQSLSELSDYFDNSVAEDGWQIVTKDDTLPSTMDIEMAIEKLLAKEYIKETYSLILDRSSEIVKNASPIPYLFSLEYVLEMGCVIVGQSSKASVNIYNYGSRNACVRLKKSEKINNLAKQGIIINFKDQTRLMPAGDANLEVSFKPEKIKARKKSVCLKKKFYLEVSNGFTLPIMILATVTYPFVTLNTKCLNFDDVLIGQCVLMHVLIKNDGLVECQWEAKLQSNKRNKSDVAFYMQNNSNVYSPGQFGSIKIYFKPRKCGYAESKLTIHVINGSEPLIIDLRGQGIEHKIKIVDTFIKFPSVLPYDSSEGIYFTVQNISHRPLEFYWQHLDELSLHNDRLIRVLTHYYQVEEILLPYETPPMTLPSQLIDFYNSLVKEMAIFFDFNGHSKMRKKSSAVTLFKEHIDAGSSSISMSRHLQVSDEQNQSLFDDPNEIENALHRFIDYLQEDPDFRGKMKDPVKAVFDALEKEESQLGNLQNRPEISSTEPQLDLQTRIYLVFRPKIQEIRPTKMLERQNVFDIVAVKPQINIVSHKICDSDNESPDSFNYREEPIESRLVLQPHELRKFKIYFRPTHIGLFQNEFTLVIVNSADTSYSIKAVGFGDIPRLNIDPFVVFGEVKAVKKNEMNDPTYFTETQIFDFGSLLLIDKDNKYNHKKASLKLWNTSKLAVELDISLTANKLKIFDIEPRSILIKPEEFGLIDITAKVMKLGSNEDQIAFTIKNNPHVDFISLRSNGTKLHIELERKHISFGRILHNQEQSKNVTVHNNSLVPIFWKITPIDSLDEQITYSPSKGSTKPCSKSNIEFRYLAKRVGITRDNVMKFEVFLTKKNDDNDPIFVDSIKIAGETYDVTVDVNSTNPIDFGTVQVHSIANASFTMKNQGQYDVNFVIEFEKRDKLLEGMNDGLRKNLFEDLKISPSKGSLPPNKITTINVTFQPKIEMQLKKACFLQCNLFDKVQSANAVAEVPLKISVAAHYSRFRLIPDSQIDFGPVAVFTKKILQFSIQNIGTFSFHYQIVNPLVATIDEGNLKKQKKVKSPGSVNAKQGNAKSREAETILRSGPFKLPKNEGNIKPGDTDILSVECYPEIEGHLEEKIVAVVEKSSPEEKNGNFIILSVDSCLPKINFRDFDAIFSDSYIVDDYQNFNCPKDIESYTIYSRKEECLYFERVNVNKTQSATIKLDNGNVVPASVTVKLCPDVLTPANTETNTFVLDSVHEFIPAMSSKIFTVFFTPVLIEKYNAILEAHLELPSQYKIESSSSKLSIKLSGEGCVPEIILVEPSTITSDKCRGNYSMGFGRCIVNEETPKNLIVKNIGKVVAKVIVDIFNDSDFVYAISLTKDSLSSNNYWPSTETPKEHQQRSIVCTLNPDELNQFLVVFRPKEIGRSKAQVRLFVTDNPYEILTVELNGEGFIEDILLEGLPLVEVPKSNAAKGAVRSRKSRKLRNSASTSLPGSNISITTLNDVTSAGLIYNLDYGNCFVKKMNKTNFKIVNKSKDRFFRFEWASHPNIVFVPSIGHLECSGWKNISVTFLATESMTIKQTAVECSICEIKLSGEQNNANSWDDRQTTVQWIYVDSVVADDETFEERTSKRTVLPSDEPNHEIVAETARSIKLLLSARATYTVYSCDVEEIKFEDTLMYQKSECNFTMKNPGDVDVVFAWKIDMADEYPSRLSKIELRAAALKRRNNRNIDSRPDSRSSGALYAARELQFFRACGQNKRSETLFRLDVGPYDYPCSSTSDLFSSSAHKTQRSSDSWIENGEDHPFSIKPDIDVIPAGESINFTVRFSPIDVFDYKAKLFCQIENLAPNLQSPTISITAKSLLPYCHFDIKESDYLTNGKRKLDLIFPACDRDLVSEDLQALINDLTAIRVVELKIIGIGENHVKEFYLINPTDEDYRFSWRDLSPPRSEDISYFQCVQEESLAESGKREKIVFTFFAKEYGIFESLWLFSIDKYNLKCLFLLAATVAEPSVYFINQRLSMAPTILGSKISESVTIINNENMQFPFKILPSSLASQSQTFQSITVTPMSGILAPKAEQILQITLHPNRVGEFNFLLRSQVKSMKNPLNLQISAKVIKTMARVLYKTDVTGQMIEAHFDHEINLDFGKLTLNKTASIAFEICNIGDVAFHYTWDLGTEEFNNLNRIRGYVLTISKESERVLSDSSSKCYLELTALQKCAVRRRLVILKIKGGPVYRMFVKASAKRSSIELNFTKYDFGPSYILDQNDPAYVTQLLITNNDKTPVIIDGNFRTIEKSPSITVNLEALSEAISGNSTVAIPINFRPLEPICYQADLNLSIDGLKIQQNISIKGEGIVLKIHLANLRDKFVELGNVSVDKIVTRKIQISNAGKASVKIFFDLMKNLPGYDEHRRRMKMIQQEKSSIQSKLHQSIKFNQQPAVTTSYIEEISSTILLNVLNIQPEAPVFLAANKTIDLIIKFKPTKRMNNFVEKVGAQVNSTIIPLFFLHGSCVAREFNLNRSHLYFGTVVEGCSTNTKLVLHNSGDFGARFKWNIQKLKPHFDLKPISGYCSPGMNVTFTVVFRPLEKALILEAEATVDIEKHPSLKLSCSGSCCRIPDPISVLKFAVPVRSSQSKNITVTNDSSVLWNIETALVGEYFQTEANFNIIPNNSYSCIVTYTPFVMNTEKNCHQGKLLVKLPEGKPPLVYELVGISLPPEVLSKIIRQLPAKTKYSELLPVHNWLDKPQSFRCDIKLLNDLKTNSVLYNFIGNNRLDVPAKGTRDFRATFYCYKETILNFRITFTNAAGEYQFYEVQYKVSKPEILEIIKLITSARSTACYLLKIDNPLEDRSVTFSANCQHQDIIIKDSPKVLSAKTSDTITIQYLPLKPTKDVARLEINCPEFGVFPYELKLKATPAPAEKITHVNAVFGSSTNSHVILKNVSNKNVEFKIKVDDTSFTCNEIIEASPYKDAILEINYEPCDIKNVTATLTASSESLGEMLFPIVGSCALPKPQGPFTIIKNSSIDIIVKNVFTVPKTFQYALRPKDYFSIDKSSDVIQSKKTATIVVKFRSLESSSEEKIQKHKYPVTGKLTVYCDDPDILHVSWIYYLRGVTE